MSTNSLDYFIIADPDSGTFFGANNAVILDTRWLTPEELEQLNEGSDAERHEIVTTYGRYIENLLDADSIAKPESGADDGENGYGPSGDFSSAWLGQ